MGPNSGPIFWSHCEDTLYVRCTLWLKTQLCPKPCNSISLPTLDPLNCDKAFSTQLRALWGGMLGFYLVHGAHRCVYQIPTHH